MLPTNRVPTKDIFSLLIVLICKTKYKCNLFLQKRKIKIVGKIACQNYISTEYIGKFPNFARKGASFIMKCRHGNTNEKYRRFGTDDCMY